MSGTISNYFTEHDELKSRACAQEEQCNTLSNDLDEVIATSKERINSSMMDMMTEWKNLLEGAQVNEQKAIEWETCPEYRKTISIMYDRLASRTQEIHLPFSDAVNILARTRTEADHLLNRAYEIEQSATELFSESSRLTEDLQSLEEGVENTIQTYQWATDQLIKKGEATDYALKQTACQQQETQKRLDETTLKKDIWDIAHDISKTIWLTYPLTKHKAKKYGARLSYLEKTQTSLTQDRQSHELQNRETQDSLRTFKEAARVLASIGTFTKATSERADNIRTMARNTAQRTGNTINEASDIINAVGSMTLRVHSNDHGAYLQHRASIVEALQKISAHIHQTPHIYDPQVRAEAQSLDNAVLAFRTSEFVKIFAIQAEMPPRLESGEL
ncbi:hypothetical protein F5Y09DRAFT_347217 [Xylaria sp. FL1042]|nr:hypothetical protein F5Y09DRAFT_347217 [Xylaria sp. FL1042]